MLNESHPIIRRTLRFIMLPYCYIKFVNWKQCSRNRVQVFLDFLYFFFKLKTYPDNYGPCRLWELDKKKWALYYGSSYHPFQRNRLRKRVQRYDYQILFNDKAVCEQLYKSLNIRLPVTVGLINIDENYRENLIRLFDKTVKHHLIVKPIQGQAGMGIVIAEKLTDGDIVIHTKNKTIPVRQFKMEEDAVVQELVEQDSLIASISSTSVNTIRVVTLLQMSGEVQIVSSTMRFGVGSAFVDNWSAGGIAVGVNQENGILKKYAFDKSGNRYTAHPVSSVIFKGFEIPHWEEVLDVARKVQKASQFYRLIGMDIAIDKEKHPVLIEVNANPDLIFQEQTSGPLLENSETLKAFSEYDLLVNNEQKKLLKHFDGLGSGRTA
jgi:glutathione synthase/RimK-type ligase-like ATP-grasp enzyme